MNVMTPLPFRSPLSDDSHREPLCQTPPFP